MSKPRLSKRQIMASREYFIKGTEPLQRITVRIGFPRRLAGKTDYICPVEMIGWGARSYRPVRSADAFGALQLALFLIGTELKYLDEKSDGGLRWADGSRSDIGFPAYPDYSLKPVIDGDPG